MAAKKTVNSSDVAARGTIAGRKVNIPGEEEVPRKNKPKLKATSQQNKVPGFVFQDTPVYGEVYEVDTEATERAHAAIKNSEEN